MKFVIATAKGQRPQMLRANNMSDAVRLSKWISSHTAGSVTIRATMPAKTQDATDKNAGWYTQSRVQRPGVK